MIKQSNLAFDLTQNRHNQLSEATHGIVKNIDKPIELTLYSQDPDTILASEFVIERYQRLNPNLHYRLSKSHISPSFNEKYHFSQNGLVIEQGNRFMSINLDNRTLNESHLTRALIELTTQNNQYVVFIEGHGEPSPYGKENQDYLLLNTALKNHGFQVISLNLSKANAIPENTALLVLSAPKTDLMPKEQRFIEQYIQEGHHFLWMMNPDSKTMPELEKLLGIKRVDGTIIDAHGHQMGTPHPAITVIQDYPNDKLFQNINVLSAFPWSSALVVEQNETFEATPLLQTHANAWVEKSLSQDQTRFVPAADAMMGPLTLGLKLSSTAHDAQKIIVLGNARFLSNGAIENYGNLALGMRFIHYLTQKVSDLQISAPEAQDTLQQLSQVNHWLIKYGFPLSLPMMLIGIGILLNFKRYRRYQY